MSQFAEPYAARVTAMTLGLLEAEWKRIADASTTLGLALGVGIREHLERVEAALAELFVYAEGVIADRRRHPRDDFATRLVQPSQDADRLSDRELRDSIALLILGGIDTTRMQLGLAMKDLHRAPGPVELLAARPELASKAVDEVMRVNPTVTWITREAGEDFEFQGRAIARGTTIHLFSQAAATDPRAFDGASFDITAERARHFGFGRGHPPLHRPLRGPFGHVRGDCPCWRGECATRASTARPASSPPSGNTGPIHLPVRFDAP